MRVTLAKWGNSLALRMPREIARRSRLQPGVSLEIIEENGRIILTPAGTPYDLNDLLRGITPGEMHTAFDWGEDEGREQVE